MVSLSMLCSPLGNSCHFPDSTNLSNRYKATIWKTRTAWPVFLTAIGNKVKLLLFPSNKSILVACFLMYCNHYSKGKFDILRRNCSSFIGFRSVAIFHCWMNKTWKQTTPVFGLQNKLMEDFKESFVSVVALCRLSMGGLGEEGRKGGKENTNTGPQITIWCLWNEVMLD